MNRPLFFLEAFAVASFSAACVAAAGLAFQLWPTAKRIDAASHVLLDCTWYDAKIGRMRGNGNCLPSAIEGITGSINKGAGAVAKALPEVAESAKRSAAQSVEASKELTGLARDARGAIAELAGLLRDLRSARDVLDELRAGIAHVNKETLPLVDAALRPLAGDLERIGALLDDLHAQVGAGGNVDKVVADLDVAVRTLNERLADPSIAAALSHVNGASANLERVIGYVADAFAPTKQSFWKALGLRLIPLGLGHLIPQRVSLINEPVEVKEKQ